MTNRTRRLAALMVTAALVFAVGSAFAAGNDEGTSDYPNKPIQVIIGYTSGGDSDINARLMSKYISEYIGQPLVVTNVTGAGGSIGAQQAHDADPDGYTIFFSHWGTVMNELAGLVDFTIPDGYDVVGVPLVSETTLVVAPAGGRHGSMTELMNDARANPETVRFAVVPGTVVQLTAVTIEEENDVNFHLVDPGNKAETLAALQSGQVDAALLEYSVVRDFLASGDLIALGVIASERVDYFPDIPTVREQGVQGTGAFEKKFFFYAFPQGTPVEYREIFQEAMYAAIRDPEAEEEFSALFMSLVTLSQEESVSLIDGVRNDFLPYIGAVLD